MLYESRSLNKYERFIKPEVFSQVRLTPKSTGCGDFCSPAKGAWEH